VDRESPTALSASPGPSKAELQPSCRPLSAPAVMMTSPTASSPATGSGLIAVESDLKSLCVRRLTPVSVMFATAERYASTAEIVNRRLILGNRFAVIEETLAIDVLFLAHPAFGNGTSRARGADAYTTLRSQVTLAMLCPAHQCSHRPTWPSATQAPPWPMARGFQHFELKSFHQLTQPALNEKA
jgi:hypothetical protein